MVDINIYLILLIVPAGTALINLFLPPLLKKILTTLALLYSFFLTYLIYNGQAAAFMYGDMVIFHADRLAVFAMVFVHVLSLIILVFSLKGISEKIENPFFVLYPLTVSFCNGVIVSDNSIAFLTFWGLSGAALYLYALLGRTKEAPQTAKKTFIIIGGSDAFLIMGVGLMAVLNPAADWTMSQFAIPMESVASYLAFFFLLIAAFAKAGGFPFHSWIPDFAKDAPIESSAFLPASLDKLLGIFLLARMVTTLFAVDLMINMIIITLGALTVITAVMMAMEQHNGRRLLGYHAVSQVGYMIMGVGSGHVLAFAGGLLHMINHTIYKSNLFLSLGSVEKQAGTSELDNLGGLSTKMPFTFTMALIGALSISGIPPFNGFFSKWMIYQGLIEMNRDISVFMQVWLLLCIILAVFGSALTLASFMKFIHSVFLGRRTASLDAVKEAPSNQWIGTGLLAMLCVLFGVFAIEMPLGRFIYPALTENGMDLPVFYGLYEPQILFIVLLAFFLFAFVIYVLLRKTRTDDVYIGGMLSSEKFRVAGTEFYNEIKNMVPLKSIYEAAEKKWFDIYELGGKITFTFSGLFKKAHPGQVQLYILYLLGGMLLFLWAFSLY